MNRLAAIRHVAAVLAAGSEPEDQVLAKKLDQVAAEQERDAGREQLAKDLAASIAALPAYKRKQLELAAAKRARKVMHSTTIRAYAEKHGLTAIPANIIRKSFETPESK